MCKRKPYLLKLSRCRDHEDAMEDSLEGAMAQVLVPACGHEGTSCEHGGELKQVFDGLLKYLGQIDTSLRKTSPGDKTGESLEKAGVAAKELEELSDSVKVWDVRKILSMIDVQPQLMLEALAWNDDKRMPGNLCTVFQLAVILNSQELVAKILGLAVRTYGPKPQQILQKFKVYRDLEMTCEDIARLRGNKRIVDLIVTALKGGTSDYFDNIDCPPRLVGEEEEILALLRPILNSDFDAFESRANTSSKKTVREQLLLSCEGNLASKDSLWWGAEYGISIGDKDDLFVLHRFAATTSFNEHPFLEAVLRKICVALGRTYTTRLLNLTDHTGMTPVHICMFHGQIKDFVGIVKEYCEDGLNIFNVRDGAGRTCLHIAAAWGLASAVNEMAKVDGDGFREILEAGWDSKPDTTALHLAVKYNQAKCVKILMKHGCNINALWQTFCVRVEKPDVNLSMPIGGALHVAAVQGLPSMLQTLLEDDKLLDWGMINPPKDGSHHSPCYPALHLATQSGNPLALKTLLDSGKFDPFAVDIDGDTALHFVARWEVRLPQRDLELFVGSFHLCSFTQTTAGKPGDRQKKSLSTVTGCMDLLMQAGLDMDQQNEHGQTPQLRNSAPDKLTQWWYNKLARQTQEAKAKLVAAANAVSVTAALVATASFVGPLQPPLGLSPSADAWLTGYSQVNHTAVQVFLFCDSLSFYLAIASIMLAFIPSLTVPREGLPLELRIANRVVQVSVVLLFASITFIVCAFSAASIAVVPESHWQYKTHAVVTTTLGALICSIALGLFLLRLMRLIRPNAKWIIKLNNALFSL